MGKTMKRAAMPSYNLKGLVKGNFDNKHQWRTDRLHVTERKKTRQRNHLHKQKIMVNAANGGWK